MAPILKRKRVCGNIKIGILIRFLDGGGTCAESGPAAKSGVLYQKSP
jgi:hypothetical protein